MMGVTSKVIAILEDDPGRAAAMKSALQRRLPDAETIFFDNAPDMVAWLPGNLPTVCVLSLDHDLGPNRKRDGEVFDPGIGRDVVALLERSAPTCRVLIHSSNGPAAEGMFYALQFSGWSAERVYPFGDLAWVDADWIDRVVLCVESVTTIEWPEPWRLVDERMRKYIGGELRWELSHFPDHPLANRSFQVVAMADAYDNAIIQFDDSSFGYVKLTWGQQSPHFAPIGDEAQVVRFLRDDAVVPTTLPGGRHGDVVVWSASHPLSPYAVNRKRPCLCNCARSTPCKGEGLFAADHLCAACHEAPIHDHCEQCGRMVHRGRVRCEKCLAAPAT